MELETTNFCTYWPNNPTFDPKRVLLRQFFIDEDQTKYVSVGFYYVPLVEFGVVQSLGPKPSFSAMNKWTQWRRACLCYGTPCV